MQYFFKLEKPGADDYICGTLYKQVNAQPKKNPKKLGAQGLFASAVNWAEMAADHENGQNPKKKFSPYQGHYVAS